MSSIGYDEPLYIQPFDHRGSFKTGMFGWTGALSPDKTATIAATKQVIYEGFKAALREYGDDFAKHIEIIQPTFCKVLVRYNPEGDGALNERQATRLKRLSDYLRGEDQSKFMFELLVPAEESQLTQVNGNKQRYDMEIRPRLTVQAIHQLQDAQVEPDVWKIEGLDGRQDCKNIVAAARRGGRDNVGCIILGRGENDDKVHEWLRTAAGVAGFIGFAVGRTSFWNPLIDLRANKITRDAAVADIARRFCEDVDIFENARNEA